MWLAHMFGQRGTKNKIKLTKAFFFFFKKKERYYRFTVKKPKTKGRGSRVSSYPIVLL